MKQQEIIEFLLPEGITKYFTLSSIEKNDDCYVIQLEEKNELPVFSDNDKLVSKGFYEPISIQDFPLRGKACFLKVKRRRWLNETTGATVARDWDVVAKGTRMTKEFAFFLKGISRY